MTENFNGNKYVAENNGEILLTIERVSENTYHAKNKFTDMKQLMNIVRENLIIIHTRMMIKTQENITNILRYSAN